MKKISTLLIVSFLSIQINLSAQESGILWSWGSNGYGEPGDVTFEDNYIPTQIVKDKKWISVAAGSFHTIAISNGLNSVNENRNFVDDTSLKCTPNPVSENTNIEYYMPKAAYVSLKIYKIAGQLVQTISEGEATSGQHQLSFDAGSLASGIYNIQLITYGVKVNELLVVEK